jgi:hypothetical protein
MQYFCIREGLVHLVDETALSSVELIRVREQASQVTLFERIDSHGTSDVSCGSGKSLRSGWDDHESDDSCEESCGEQDEEQRTVA